ncbi:MAG: methyltransferase family protein [Terracidiphilus sp.]
MNFDYGAWAARRRVPLAFVFAVAYAILSQPTFELLVIGSGLALIGILLRALAAGHIEKSRVLAASGPFCYVRHPLYLGSFIVGSGLMVAAGSWVLGVAFGVLFAIIYGPVMFREDAFLRKKFGPVYDDYARRVPLLFPLPGRARTATGRFQWQQYRANREYEAALGFVAVVIFLAIKLMLK